MKYRIKNTMGQERPKWVDNLQKFKLFAAFGVFGVLAFILAKDIKKRGL